MSTLSRGGGVAFVDGSPRRIFLKAGGPPGSGGAIYRGGRYSVACGRRDIRGRCCDGVAVSIELGGPTDTDKLLGTDTTGAARI